MKNKIFLPEKLILQKLEEQSHTLTNSSKYVTTKMLNKYSNICISIPVALVVANDYVSILTIIICLSIYVEVSYKSYSTLNCCDLCI